QVKKKVTTKWL
ncbi:DUF4219 domain-containing protein/UBN2 domain-containing protein, partial [Cephalotus follicularis]